MIEERTQNVIQYVLMGKTARYRANDMLSRKQIAEKKKTFRQRERMKWATPKVQVNKLK